VPNRQVVLTVADNFMNTKLIVWIIGIFLGAIIVAVLWYFMYARNDVQQTVQSSINLPVSDSYTPNPISQLATTSIQSPSQKIPLPAQNGNIVFVEDFINNGVTMPDAANAGRYMLAGNLDYCLSNPQECQVTSATNYNVYYESKSMSFVIALTEEPIGQARLDMEQFMLATLGVLEQQLCSLNYYVGVTRYLNEQYSGKNLGFSFCPGAVILPK
jgi:hypothetical protein